MAEGKPLQIWGKKLHLQVGQEHKEGEDEKERFSSYSQSVSTNSVFIRGLRFAPKGERSDLGSEGS